MPQADLPRALRRRTALSMASVAETEGRQRAVLAALPEGVLLQDADGNVLLANDRARELLGLSGLMSDPPLPTPRSPTPQAPFPAEPDRPGSVQTVRLTPVTGIPLPRQATAPRPTARRDVTEALDRLADTTLLALRSGEVQQSVIVPITREGGTRLLSVTAIPLLGDDGRAQAVVSSFSDATAAQEQLATRRRGEDMFRQTMQHSPIGMAVTALNGRFLRVNRTLCRMFGYRSDELQERTLYGLMHPEDVEETSLRIGRLLRGDVDSITLERRYVGQGGMRLWGVLCITVVRDSQGRPLHFVVQVEDVSPVHTAQDLVTRMTLHDPLTGLGNRALVLDRIQKALDRRRPPGRRVAVLHCDLDHFKLVNDSAGHEQGDALLIDVGARISRVLHGGDTLGRLGGDEFVVVCDDVADEREAIAVAERVQHAVSRPLRLQMRTLVPTLSIGIALSAGSDADPADLLQDAGLASYRAKERGRNRWDVVDGELRGQATERLDLEQALRSGIAAGQLELHFQPIVDVRTRAVVGREALVRWNHPERGLLGPMLFLPVAEESGLIQDVGAWVLAEAARAAAAAPQSVGYVAINVSPNQVTRPGLSDAVQQALADAGLAPERLVIELTESVMLSAAPAARREIEHLHGLGVRIVVDDFGTGFSALSYLRDLPVSGIKVDRSFTAGLGSDSQCDRIVEALTGLGHGLGVDVVVEGVETERQREILADLGAEHAQGYLFGRPGPTYDLVPA